LKTFQKHYGAIADRSGYQKVGIYLGIIQKMIKDPTQVRTSAFYEYVRSAFTFQPMEQEDLWEINFYAWLKAQLTGEDYRNVLQELFQRATQPIGH
ncbi:MAG: hypothetical protein AAF206_15765, partial [Bacteroidota bacterium]